jgi:hypothetical protein
MSDSSTPGSSRVFLVGFNQATPFDQTITKDHNAYIDALFNRNGCSIRELYKSARGRKRPSPTRRNISCLTARLVAKGVADVLETNVVCYATPMGRDLADKANAGGVQKGTTIFVTLLDEIRPQILLAHGEATRSLDPN